MHAGEGLWNLCAVLTAFERKANGNPEVLRLTGLGHESIRSIAEHLKVPLPDAASLEARVNALAPAAQAAPREQARPERQQQKGPPSGEVRAAIALCEDILARLDDLPANASEFAESVETKVSSMKAWIEDKNHVTEKMQSSLENMLSGTNKWLNRGEKEGEYEDS